MANFSRILQYRRIIISLSQILGAIICIYFIIYAQQYQVSWNLLLWVLPSAIIIKINTLLSTIGTYILIIPLSIIIVSLLIPENITLRILGSFFGIATSIIFITSGILRNTIHEAYNMRVFLVTKILTIEEKRIIFTQEFLRIINEQYSKNIMLYNYLKQYLSDQYWTTYNIKLHLLKEKTEIQSYAYDIVDELINNLRRQKETAVLMDYSYVFKKLVIIFSMLLLALIILAGLRYMWESNVLKEGFELVKKGTELSAQSTDSLHNTQKLVSDLTKLNTEQSLAIALSAANQLDKAAKAGFNNTTQRLDEIEDGISRIVKLMKLVLDNTK